VLANTESPARIAWTNPTGSPLISPVISRSSSWFNVDEPTEETEIMEGIYTDTVGSRPLRVWSTPPKRVCVRVCVCVCVCVLLQNGVGMTISRSFDHISVSHAQKHRMDPAISCTSAARAAPMGPVRLH